MPSLSIRPPADYVLSRDVCSYGYFLLAPNHWSAREQAFTRVFSLAAGPMVGRITQRRGPGESLRVTTSRAISTGEKGELRAQLTRMLRLDEDENAIADFHRVDPRFKISGRGRVFRSPTFFEDVIKTVTSCNVQWPSTIHMNRRLCEILGTRAPGAGASPGVIRDFPSAAKIARTRPQTLRARCRVGYRDARIVELGRLFKASPSRAGIDVAWFENPATPDDAVYQSLMELPGIGPYAAANIMQLLGRYARLPLDTESVRHGKAVLGFTGSSAQIMRRVHQHFAPFGPHAFRSYWFELWEHYERKHGPSHTWERDDKGKLFTPGA